MIAAIWGWVQSFSRGAGAAVLPAEALAARVFFAGFVDEGEGGVGGEGADGGEGGGVEVDEFVDGVGVDGEEEFVIFAVGEGVEAGVDVVFFGEGPDVGVDGEIFRVKPWTLYANVCEAFAQAGEVPWARPSERYIMAWRWGPRAWRIFWA